MNALIDTISEKLIILSLLNVHFLVSINMYVYDKPQRFNLIILISYVISYLIFLMGHILQHML